jgi:hypothetical protein
MREGRVPPADHLGLGARVGGVREEGQPPGAFQHLVRGEGQLHIAGEGGARAAGAAVGSAASRTGSRRQGQRCTPGQHMRGGEGARGDGTPGTEQAGAAKLSDNGTQEATGQPLKGPTLGEAALLSSMPQRCFCGTINPDCGEALVTNDSLKLTTGQAICAVAPQQWAKSLGACYLGKQRDSDTILGGAFLWGLWTISPPEVKCVTYRCPWRGEGARLVAGIEGVLIPETVRTCCLGVFGCRELNCNIGQRSSSLTCKMMRGAPGTGMCCKALSHHISQ